MPIFEDSIIRHRFRKSENSVSGGLAMFALGDLSTTDDVNRR
jgi:hypothetical protein